MLGTDLRILCSLDLLVLLLLLDAFDTTQVALYTFQDCLQNILQHCVASLQVASIADFWKIPYVL